MLQPPPSEAERAPMPAGMASAGSSSLTTTLTEGRQGSCAARGSEEGARDCEMAEFAMAQTLAAGTAASATPLSESSEAGGAARKHTPSSLSGENAPTPQVSNETAALLFCLALPSHSFFSFPPSPQIMVAKILESESAAEGERKGRGGTAG